MAKFHGVYLKLGRIDSTDDIVNSIFLIVTKSRSDTTNQCSDTAELKSAILQ